MSSRRRFTERKLSFKEHSPYHRHYIEARVFHNTLIELKSIMRLRIKTAPSARSALDLSRSRLCLEPKMLSVETASSRPGKTPKRDDDSELHLDAKNFPANYRVTQHPCNSSPVGRASAALPCVLFFVGLCTGFSCMPTMHLTAEFRSFDPDKEPCRSFGMSPLGVHTTEDALSIAGVFTDRAIQDSNEAHVRCFLVGKYFLCSYGT